MKIILLSLFTILCAFQVAICQTSPFGESTKTMTNAIANKDTLAMAEIILMEIKKDSKKENKNLCLLLVADYGILQSTKYLIEIGAEVDCLAPANFRTPLLTAASSGHINIVSYLLANGANINAKDSMAANALILASTKGNLDMIKFLVEKGIDTHAIMDGGYNARDMAKGRKVKKYLREIGIK